MDLESFKIKCKDKTTDSNHIYEGTYANLIIQLLVNRIARNPINFKENRAYN